MRILITSGPTREYLDPVRFLSNGSSGKMGAALAAATLAVGFDVAIVSGPVSVDYPKCAEIIHVTTTEEMLQKCLQQFPNCVGVIGAAAPCDYKLESIAAQKMTKRQNKELFLKFVETPDILEELGKIKRNNQWIVPFALETNDDSKSRAIKKLHQKNGDLILLNGPRAMYSDQTKIEVLNKKGETIASICDTKDKVAVQIISIIQKTMNTQFSL
ncbi:MAG: phosphopantothenoylcysteine decarboxylase [Planctomycetaceae bacterium]|nr:phosphopantothenoylcysteine decarboxylase [Planctomycetaceae bacterium]